MTPKVMIVTKSGLRHRLFLRLAKEALGDSWVATCIQAPDQASNIEPAPTTLRSRAIDLIRTLRRIGRPSPTSSAERSADSHMQASLDMAPMPDAEVPGLFRVTDPNSAEARTRLQSIEPDLVLIYGSAILQHEWLTVPRLGALNMHYGILPWYRSANSTPFALLHERPDRVGATIHYIDSGIDSGAIVRRFHVSPHQYSDLNALTAAVYVAGARGLVACALESIHSGSRLASAVESAEGSIYSARHGTPDVMHGARWRLRELNQRWPFTESSLEKSLARSPLARVPRRPPAGVYVLLYHSLTDPSHRESWETSYGKVATDARRFREQMDFLLADGFQPLPLSEAPEALRRGSPKGRYFAVTFDDAYSNVAAVEPFLSARKIAPTVFVNGAFCEEAPYFRVLAAVLRDSSGTLALHAELQSAAPHIKWSRDPNTLFNQTKDLYIAGTTESAVNAAYARVVGDPRLLKCHLDVDALRTLEAKGWQIGNHTWEHKPLSALGPAEVEEAIDRNLGYLRASGLHPINWLSYPNGLATHVNQAVKTWLDRNPDVHGIFAGGGMNLIYSRTQWLRISIGNPDLNSFKRIIGQNIDASMKTIGRL